MKPITNDSLYDTEQVSALTKDAVKDYPEVGAVSCITNPGKLKHALVQHQVDHPNETTTMVPLFYKGTDGSDIGHYTAAAIVKTPDGATTAYIQDSNGNVRDVPPSIEKALKQAYPGIEIEQWDLHQQDINGNCGPLAVQNIRDMAKFRHEHPDQGLTQDALSVQTPMSTTEMGERRAEDDEIAKTYRQNEAAASEAAAKKAKSYWDIAMDSVFGKGGLLDFTHTSLLPFDAIISLIDKSEADAKKAKAKVAAKSENLSKNDDVEVASKLEEAQKEVETSPEKDASKVKERITLEDLQGLKSPLAFQKHEEKQLESAVSDANLGKFSPSGSDSKQSFVEQMNARAGKTSGHGGPTPAA